MRRLLTRPAGAVGRRLAPPRWVPIADTGATVIRYPGWPRAAPRADVPGHGHAGDGRRVMRTVPTMNPHPDPRLSRFEPLPRILFFDDFDDGLHGWIELIGNYEGALDSML